MAAAGLDCIVRSEEMAVMGLTEVVHHLPRIWREFRKLKHSIRARRPSVAILIDFPEIHFRLAREFHRLGVPVLYFVSPQLWAWKKHRIKLVREYVDRMLVIFPFEEPFYRERGVHAEFVGHPLADLPLPTITRDEYAKKALQIPHGVWNYGAGPAGLQGGISPTNPAIKYELDPRKEWIALLPGSRAHEINMNLREMVTAAHQLGDSYEYLIPVAPTLNRKQVEGLHSALADMVPDGFFDTIHLVHDPQAALLHARASIVASGTATVEAALIGNPFVVVYRVSPITYAIAKRVVTVPHVAMANLIAGKRVVPELIQNDFTASNVVRELQLLLPDGPPRQSMMQELQRVRALLIRPGEIGAIDRVADVALGMLGVASPVTCSETTDGVSRN